MLGGEVEAIGHERALKLLGCTKPSCLGKVTSLPNCTELSLLGLPAAPPGPWPWPFLVLRHPATDDNPSPDAGRSRSKICLTSKTKFLPFFQCESGGLMLLPLTYPPDQPVQPTGPERCGVVSATDNNRSPNYLLLSSSEERCLGMAREPVPFESRGDNST